MNKSAKKSTSRKTGATAKKHVINKWIILIPCMMLCLALVVTAVIFFIPRDNTSFSYECWQLRFAVSDFLDDIIDENYNSAAQSVCFVSAEDGRELKSNDIHRGIWCRRMEALRKGVRNNYLEDYNELSVRKENGVFVVTVLLTVQYQGQPDTFYDDPHVLTVVEVDGEWKIASISEEAIQTDFEKAISGVISAAELERGDL
ncbi:MAG: hypothetical protein J6C26_09890 [Clostridia bacterium]|nr:hypothetical protein [Clostridia bacterium]